MSNEIQKSEAMKYITIKIELSETAIAKLEQIVDGGCFGKSVEEAATRMVESFIRHELPDNKTNWITYKFDAKSK